MKQFLCVERTLLVVHVHVMCLMRVHWSSAEDNVDLGLVKTAMSTVLQLNTQGL